MNLLHVINTLDPAFGGPVEAVRQFTACSGQTATVEVLALGPYAPGKDWTVPVHILKGGITKYSFSPGMSGWLRDNVRRFDAVVVHGIWHYHLVGTWRGLRGTGVPYFAVLHGMLDPWFRRTYPLKHSKKALFWHTLVHPSLREAAAVLFLCEEERRRARLTFPMKLRGDAIAALGIQAPPPDSSAETLFARFPALREKRLLAFVGRICYMKGCDLLLRAFADVCGADPAFHLVMCGPDAENWQPRLLQLAASLGITDRVTWTGPVYGEEKWAVLRAAELFVLPSHCETFPVAVLEALACGTPAMITNRVGIYREVHDGRAGIVCEDNETSLRNALFSWLHVDATERDNFRAAALDTFRRQFDIRAAFARQVELIREFAASRSANSSTAGVGGDLAIR